jgi:acetyltransferase-like isoleucine patch superfamily enzyme
MRKTSFYTHAELLDIGFKELGKDVKISRRASIYDPQKMIIGDHVRIDDFCVLSGRIELKNRIHLATGVVMEGGDEGIFMDDFSALAFKTIVITGTDDYTGHALTNPTVTMNLRKMTRKEVRIGRHVVVGGGSFIMPGVNIAEGCSVGGMSFVTKSTEPWFVYFGIPAKKLKARSKKLLELENKLSAAEK